LRVTNESFFGVDITLPISKYRVIEQILLEKIRNTRLNTHTYIYIHT